ncbi:LuxR C-terminal-related transcriptional regulator [Nonomuraea sp. CA-141351]|uniref:helix-turn-helix transcriptional regulator n=1 Tax=Nonomuraea sp. CA-141351 TaxID=3239996 RepID=UPI003D8D12C6
MMYETLGLGEDAEKMYRRILTDGPLPAAMFTEGTAEATSIEVLRAEGLVFGRDRLTAARPGLALGSRILRRAEGVVAAQARLAELEELYVANVRHHAERIPVEVMTDGEQVRRSFVQIEQAARKELMSFVTWPYRVMSEPPPPAPGEEHPRCRILLEEEVFKDPAALQAAQHSRDSGCEIRVIDKLPFKLLIGDRSQAMVPQLPGESLPVLLVHPGVILDSLVAVFETYWAQALPRRSAWRNNGTDEARPTEQEITILRHLARGATEGAIATTLGISRRTVIRRVQSLMDRAGVDTRLQLGVHAVRSGWLGRLLD